jgi:hypothetical protein
MNGKQASIHARKNLCTHSFYKNAFVTNILSLQNYLLLIDALKAVDNTLEFVEGLFEVRHVHFSLQNNSSHRAVLLLQFCAYIM